jgi:hypothetical protein
MVTVHNRPQNKFGSKMFESTGGRKLGNENFQLTVIFGTVN